LVGAAGGAKVAVAVGTALAVEVGVGIGCVLLGIGEGVEVGVALADGGVGVGVEVEVGSAEAVGSKVAEGVPDDVPTTAAGGICVSCKRVLPPPAPCSESGRSAKTPLAVAPAGPPFDAAKRDRIWRQDRAESSPKDKSRPTATTPKRISEPTGDRVAALAANEGDGGRAGCGGRVGDGGAVGAGGCLGAGGVEGGGGAAS